MVTLGSFARLEATLAVAEERHTTNAVATFVMANGGEVHGVPVQADLWAKAPNAMDVVVSTPMLRVRRDRVPGLDEGDTIVVGSGPVTWTVRQVDTDGPGLWLTVWLAGA